MSVVVVVVVVVMCSTILSPHTHPPPYASKQTRVHNNEEKGMHFQLTLQVLTCKST
jgi:hypothetical protein